MNDERSLVLLNDAVKGHVLALSARERARLREKFEFLENGFWDAGVRVKKLKGVTGRVVFEARIDKGDRLLFTLGSHRRRTAIYVWGISRHDDIASTAARIMPRNAPFLDFEPLAAEERHDLSFEAPPREWLSQEDVEQVVPEDYGPQKWIVLDDAEWRRLLASPNPDSYEAFLFLTREQEDLLRVPTPVLLSGTAGSGKTTLSVYYLLRGATAGSRQLFLTYNPLLKSLAERIHAGLIEKREGGPSAAPRFLVFRELLQELTRSGAESFPSEKEVGFAEFCQIYADHRDRRAYDAELVWEEIRSIIKGSKLPLNAARLALLARDFTARELAPFAREELLEYLLGLENLSLARRAEAFIQQRTSFGDYAGFVRTVASVIASSKDSVGECAKVLDELVRLVEKSAADFSSPLLSVEEYLALGKKRAPVFLYDRREIYAIAEFYQDRLVRSGRWDEIDLTKAALRSMDGAGQPPPYDLVVCDEVQDLTDIQLSLVFRLAANPQNVVLTGDPRQIVNPSGFRWEEVKNKLFERGLPVPTVHRLTLNFRCVGSIVQLSNALLDLKAGLIGLSDTEMREQWKFNGRPPLVLSGVSEEEVFSTIEGRGAGQVILTRSAEERDRLKRALRTELVFTIAEAKGLEFEAVFLWKFCDEARGLWRAIAESGAAKPGGSIDQSRIPHVRHELALLYVAVTRARNTLIVYDGPSPAAVWDIPSLAALVFIASEKDRLGELWRSASSPREWESQGDYFMAREHYGAARECFKNAGAEAKLALASAHLHVKAGEHAKAAPLFEEGGDREKAADCYERSGLWERALPLWRSLGNERREKLSSAHVHEREGRFEKAAREWEALGEQDRALENWEKAGAFDKVGRALANAGDFERAAQMLQKARLPLEAAACLARAGKASEAADLYLRAGDARKAARLYKQDGNTEKLLRCYRQMGDHLAIALLHESRGDLTRAIDAFAQHAAGSEADRAALVASIPEAKNARAALKAAVRYAALAMPEKAGPLFSQAGEPALAAAQLEKAGAFDTLFQSYMETGRFLDAARVMEKAPLADGEKIEGIQNALIRHFSNEGNPETLTALHDEARGMLSAGRLVPAAARFRLLLDEDGIREAYLRLGLHEEALRFFVDAAEPTMAGRYAATPGVRLSSASVGSLVEEIWGGNGPQSQTENDQWLETSFILVDAGLRDAPREAAIQVFEKIFGAAGFYVIRVDEVPQACLDLLLQHRASNVIIRLLQFSLDAEKKRSQKLGAFISHLSRAADESGDTVFAACAAYAEDRDAFEHLAGALSVTEENVIVCAMSAARYRDAVRHLVESGRSEEAVYFARAHKDFLLAGECSERQGDLKHAARSYMEGGHYDAALRCYKSAEDPRGEARVYEHQGRLAEAIEIWTRLGRPKDVERVRKRASST
jgi:tetratricopeptide (TPR) repeat protein